MNRVTHASPFILGLALLAVSCAPAEVGEAGQAVQTFYDHLNNGRGDAALALYSDDVRGMLGGEEGRADDTFTQWLQKETRDGSIEEVKIVDEDVDDAAGTATVRFELHYLSGEPADRTVTLTKHEGSWKLGFIDQA